MSRSNADKRYYEAVETFLASGSVQAEQAQAVWDYEDGLIDREEMQERLS